MAELYGPFNAGAGANFDETQWREFFGNLFSPGVIHGATTNGSAAYDLILGPTTGMVVQLARGCAVVYGFAYENNSVLNKTLANSDPSLNRIDYVVVEFNFTARTVTCVVLQGTLASSPVAPTLTQNSTLWDVPIATVYVGHGVSSIVAGNITDQRQYAQVLPSPFYQGPGSGLNADMLDGISSSGFMATGSTAANSLLLAGHAPGSGNGLDADTVDGNQASAFVLGASASQHIIIYHGGSAPPNSTGVDGDIIIWW